VNVGLSYLQFIPALMAEESLQLSTALAVGSGTLEERSRKDIVQAWRSAIEKWSEPAVRPKRRKPKNAQEIIDRIRGEGLPISIEVKHG